MNKIIFPLVAASACLVSQLASAVPVRATFDGTVAGAAGLFDSVLADFPIGTAASFDLTFDDSGLVAFAPVSDFDLAPVSGWVRAGGLEWALDAGRIYTYSYLNGPDFPIVAYGLQLTGTGPTIAGGGASLFGLFLGLTADAAPNPAAGGPMLGFAYPFAGGEFYSYAGLSGNFTTSRERTAVPEPNSALLMCSALVLLVGWRVKKVRAG